MSRITPEQAHRIVEAGFSYAYVRYGLPMGIANLMILAALRLLLKPVQSILSLLLLHLLVGALIAAPLFAGWVLQHARKSIK
jgi:hypothetical protein